MRLINTETGQLSSFTGDRVPNYAILSHTWRSEEDEILYEDISKSAEELQKKPTYSKLSGLTKVAVVNGYEWIWLDTCCINKSSSAELSEAINSMYRWYKDAEVCYVYLEDVDIASKGVGWLDEFKASRWFTRGWTLQELLAPQTVEFYDKNWKEIGTRMSLQVAITEVTGIRSEALLTRPNFSDYTIAERMSWAANRKTTRDEDVTYCMLGLFGIHMPLLYGEGEKAFQRLQEEILKVHEDYTLFAWATLLSSHSGVLSRSPAAFAKPTSEKVGSWTFADEDYGNGKGGSNYQPQ